MNAESEDKKEIKFKTNKLNYSKAQKERIPSALCSSSREEKTTRRRTEQIDDATYGRLLIKH